MLEPESGGTHTTVKGLVLRQQGLGYAKIMYTNSDFHTINKLTLDGVMLRSTPSNQNKMR